MDIYKELNEIERRKTLSRLQHEAFNEFEYDLEFERKEKAERKRTGKTHFWDFLPW